MYRPPPYFPPNVGPQIVTATGATQPRPLSDYFADAYNLEDFGTLGQADDGPTFQAAINAAQTRGWGGVMVPQNRAYTISTPLVSNRGVLLFSSYTDVSTNSNGGGAPSSRPIITWTGAAGATMYKIAPATVGNMVWGGGSTGIHWDGGNLAATCVHFDNTVQSTFAGYARRATARGVLLNSVSGSASAFSQRNYVDLVYTWGTQVAVQNSNGLECAGGSATIPSTQQRGRVTGLVYNGSMLHITQTDNCFFDISHASVQSGGTGKVLSLKAAGSVGASVANNFTYIVGPIEQDNGLYANHWVTFNSETSSMASGTSSWWGDLVDYIDGTVYTSHKRKLRDKISIGSSEFRGTAGTGASAFALQWQTITLPHGSTTSAAAILVVPYDLSTGKLTGVEVYFGTNGTAGGDYRLQVDFSATLLIGGFVTPQKTVTQTVTAAAQYTPQSATFTFTGSPAYQAYTYGQHLALKVSRIGGDAADTDTDDLNLLGARLLFESDGPTQGGSGPFTIPPWP